MPICFPLDKRDQPKGFLPKKATCNLYDPLSFPMVIISQTERGIPILVVFSITMAISGLYMDKLYQFIILLSAPTHGPFWGGWALALGGLVWPPRRPRTVPDPLWGALRRHCCK
ncbi:hypothetical protein GOODEAATRI_021048 [Goodea atripinnis]|uniref:Uncharacterized protein n=1 Tax=Goodea atripinnis TaxID=208336 RepID=A0ABV0MTW7_9TELE